jgi:hypothetical protein
MRTPTKTRYEVEVARMDRNPMAPKIVELYTRTVEARNGIEAISLVRMEDREAAMEWTRAGGGKTEINRVKAIAEWRGKAGWVEVN